MPNQQVQFRASEVDVEFIELLTASGTFNILPQLISFNMFEDIYEPSLVIEIGINDSVDLPFLGPIVGEEILNMRFATRSTIGGQGTDIDPGDMYMTSIKQRTIAKDRQQIYVLTFASQQTLINHNTSVSKSYRGKRIDEIVKNIFNDFLDLDENYNELAIDPTKGVENIVIPNWKPFKAIQWLAQRAINQNDVPNYLYWESNGGTFFKSIDTLVTKDAVQKFRYNPLTNDQTKLEAKKAGVMELDALEIKNQFHTLRNIDNGFYASKLITHDIVTKKLEEQVMGLDELYNSNVNHTDPYMPISNSPTYYQVQDRYNFGVPIDQRKPDENLQSFYDSSVSFYPKHDQLYSLNSGDLYENRVEDWLLKRNKLMNSLNQIKLQIKFPAISGLQVGHCIEIIVPAATKVLKDAAGRVTNRDNLTDTILSGKYLITAINHSISFIDKTSSHKYTMTCEITKDSIGSPIAGKGK